MSDKSAPNWRDYTRLEDRIIKLENRSRNDQWTQFAKRAPRLPNEWRPSRGNLDSDEDHYRAMLRTMAEWAHDYANAMMAEIARREGKDG